jgi:hypothetical protein
MLLLMMTTLAADRAVLPIVKSQPEGPARRVGESDACRDVDRGMDREMDRYTVEADTKAFGLNWNEGFHPVFTADLDPDDVDATADDLLEPGAVYLSYLLWDGTKVHMVSNSADLNGNEASISFKMSLEAVDAMSRSTPKFRRWTVDGVVYDETRDDKTGEKVYLPGLLHRGPAGPLLRRGRRHHPGPAGERGCSQEGRPQEGRGATGGRAPRSRAPRSRAPRSRAPGCTGG